MLNYQRVIHKNGGCPLDANSIRWVEARMRYTSKIIQTLGAAMANLLINLVSPIQIGLPIIYLANVQGDNGVPPIFKSEHQIFLQCFGSCVSARAKKLRCEVCPKTPPHRQNWQNLPMFAWVCLRCHWDKLWKMFWQQMAHLWHQ